MKSPLTQPEEASISFSGSSLCTVHNMSETLQAPRQASACFQILLYLYVACSELWIGDGHKSKLHWFHDFSLIVANQPSHTTSLDTLCSRTFFVLGIATGFLWYVYLCVPFSGKAARSSAPLDL